MPAVVQKGRQNTDQHCLAFAADDGGAVLCVGLRSNYNIQRQAATAAFASNIEMQRIEGPRAEGLARSVQLALQSQQRSAVITPDTMVGQLLRDSDSGTCSNRYPDGGGLNAGYQDERTAKMLLDPPPSTTSTVTASSCIGSSKSSTSKYRRNSSSRYGPQIQLCA